jgi:hypothetical protein
MTSRSTRRDDEALPLPPREIHADGPKRSIAFAMLGDGTKPARDFFDDLDEGDKDKFDSLFATMCQHGKITNDQKFRSCVGTTRCDHGGVVTRYPVSEFKIHTGSGKRILAILDGRQFVLTHGFNKGAKLPSEVKKAGRIFSEDGVRRIGSTGTKGSR